MLQVLFLLPPLGVQRTRLLFQIGELFFYIRKTGFGIIVGFLFQCFLFYFQLQNLPVKRVQLFRLGIDSHTQRRRRFVHQVNRLIRHITVGNVTVGQRGGGNQRRGVPSGTRLIADSNDPVETPVRSGYPTSIAGATASIVSQVVADYPVEVDRLTQEEKMEIMDILNRKGVFLLKGSVSYVAQALHSSEASIYRYLGKLNNKD